jgi:hypothetical protein
MKKRTFLFLGLYSLPSIALNGQVPMIDDWRNDSDTYWGGRAENSSLTCYGDGIGYFEFSLVGMIITICNNTMTDVITG